MGDLKIFDLNEMKQKFNISTFVETGTFHGDAVEYAKKTFEYLYSIEIDDDLFKECENRFKNEKNIKICHGKSIEVLPKILPEITTNTLFWLDAHFPGADAHKAAYNAEPNETIRIPLENELTIIRSIRIHYNDVFIIDDAWLYEDGSYEWGNIDDHFKKCNINTTRKELMGSTNSNFIYSLLESTHKIKKINNHQGYFIAYPKGK